VSTTQGLSYKSALFMLHGFGVCWGMAMTIRRSAAFKFSPEPLPRLWQCASAQEVKVRRREGPSTPGCAAARRVPALRWRALRGRNRILSKWACQVPRHRIGDGRPKQRARARFNSKPVPVLPTRSRASADPALRPTLDRDRHARGRKKRGAMVHHAKRSHPRGTLQAQSERDQRRRRA